MSIEHPALTVPRQTERTRRFFKLLWHPPALAFLWAFYGLDSARTLAGTGRVVRGIEVALFVGMATCAAVCTVARGGRTAPGHLLEWAQVLTFGCAVLANLIDQCELHWLMRETAREAAPAAGERA